MELPNGGKKLDGTMLPDVNVYSAYKTSSTISVGHVVALDISALAAGSLSAAGQTCAKILAAAVAASVNFIPIGIYTGKGGSGAENSALTRVGGTSNIVPGRAAAVGDVVKILRSGVDFGWGHNDGTNSIGIGDILGGGATGGGASPADGILHRKTAAASDGKAARIVALEAVAQAGTAGSGQAIRVLVSCL